MNFLSFFAMLAFFLVTAHAVSAHAAESYPQRPIRLIVPFPPGGAADIVGRMMGNGIGIALGQQVVIDNRGGGGQIIATQLAANAAPDGYTLFLSSATHSINPALRKDLPYDTLKAFAPITLVARSPLVIVAHASLKVNSINELIQVAKARPGHINYASSGVGTGGHMSIELLKSLTGMNLVHIPYKGAAPALSDVVGGQVPLLCTSPLPAMPHVKAGRLRALGITGLERSSTYPSVPTVAETVPGYQSTLWYALLAPTNTPQEIVRQLHINAVKVLSESQVKGQLQKLGAVPVGNSPQQLQAFLRSEIDRWVALVKRANIQFKP